MKTRFRPDLLRRTPDGHKNQHNRLCPVRAVIGLCALALLLTSSPAVLAQCAPSPTGAMVAWFAFDQGYDSYDLAGGAPISWSFPEPALVSPGFVSYAAPSLDGATTYAEIPNTIVANIGPGTGTCFTGGEGAFSSCTGDFSIEAWVNLQGHEPSSPETVVDKRGPGPIGYSLYINANRLGLQLADGTGVLGYDNYDSLPLTTLVDSNWHHVAVTVSRLNQYGFGGIEWYLDGIGQGGSTSFTGHNGSLVNNGPVRIGANGPDNPGGFFLGYIDGVTIYNRVLTYHEIHAIAEARYGKCKPYPFP